jgi:uncharacterized protein YcsI (UPF0317 family)
MMTKSAVTLTETQVQAAHQGTLLGDFRTDFRPHESSKLHIPITVTAAYL